MNVKAITPTEASNRESTFPNEVIEAFNELIVKNYKGGYLTILQKDAINLIVKKLLNRTIDPLFLDENNRSEKIKRLIYKEGWLDIEDFYRRAGWKVVYDKPGYCDNYEASWEFSKK